MKRKKTKRKRHGCDVAKVIDTVEQAAFSGKEGLSSYQACSRGNPSKDHETK